jgi:DNA-binding response OmpR family regulator
MGKKKLTILVIDDNPADVEIVGRLLEQIDTWEIHFLAFHDSQEGRAEAVKGKADLIFLDYMLGAETGLEVLNAIEDDGCFLPVIMLTGQGSEEIAVEAMKAGVSDYLVKGRITAESLRLVISNALQKFEMQGQIEEQRKALLDAERQRVMMESVGAACHHFAQPLTTMLNYLQMLAKGEGIEEPKKRLMFEQCLKAAEVMRGILNRFQEVREYRTRPYLADTKILDIGLEPVSSGEKIVK